MSTEGQGKTFQGIMADVAAQVQADAEAGRTGRPDEAPTASTEAPAAAPRVDPSPAAAVAAAPAATPAAPGTLGGKFKSEDEAIKAHHLLIHSTNSLKAENDRLKALLAAGTIPAAATPPLTPGRVDPSTATRASDPSDEKWKDQYGIDPTDLDARIDARAAALVEAREAPNRAMQSADAYMLQQYPDFAAKAPDVKAFVQANEALNSRFANLWTQGLYAEAMEIAYLAYDNAVRTVDLATQANQQTAQAISAQRADGSMISSQAGGAREPAPNVGEFRGTAEDMARVAALRSSGKDAEARAFIYGRMLAGIPALNGGQR